VYSGGLPIVNSSQWQPTSNLIVYILHHE